MPQRIFVDSSAFLALEDESDQHHQEALQFREQVLRRQSYEKNGVNSVFPLFLPAISKTELTPFFGSLRNKGLTFDASKIF